MIKSFKYRLFTNSNQERELAIMLETHRRLYNECLEWKNLAYDIYRQSISYNDTSRWFKISRRSNEWYGRLNFSSAQQTLRRLDQTFQKFFGRIRKGLPGGKIRFKKRVVFNSFSYAKLGDGCQIKNDRLYIQHVGLIKVKWHRPTDGKIKSVRILRELDKWYIVFTCEIEGNVEPSYNQEEVGIDVGISKFLTDSNGETVENPRLAQAAQQILKRAQRSLSRKKKGSNRRKKARRRLARLHQKVRNQRSDFHWKSAGMLVKRFGKIAVERLNVQGMLERGSRRMSRQIADVGWSSFLSKLKFKAESAGVLVVEVDCRGTSQVCAECGNVVPKNLEDRWHSCECGSEVDRDHNSAKEVLRRGKSGLGRAVGR